MRPLCAPYHTPCAARRRATVRGLLVQTLLPLAQSPQGDDMRTLMAGRLGSGMGQGGGEAVGFEGRTAMAT
eukprot:COSAG04_NODE_5033_length_1772_cov_11.775254_3_plen_70_part_01